MTTKAYIKTLDDNAEEQTRITIEADGKAIKVTGDLKLAKNLGIGTEPLRIVGKADVPLGNPTDYVKAIPHAYRGSRLWGEMA